MAQNDTPSEERKIPDGLRNSIRYLIRQTSGSQ